MNWKMEKWLTSNSYRLLGILLLISACSDGNKNGSRVEELPYYSEATYTPQWLKRGEVPGNFHRIPSFELINQSGARITEKDLDQKVTVVDFFFTACPGICPKMTNNMLLVQDVFLSDNNVQILSHSVTPEYDSVSVLKRYGRIKGVEQKRWHLLTGERSEIYDLGRNHYFVEEDLGLEKDPEDFIHTENFVLIDQNRRIRGIYNGLNKSSVNQLIADMKTLLQS